MQFPESWLRSMANPSLSTTELAHRLTMAGLEVEELHAAAPDFSGVVVGHVLETGKHPNADKLTVCQVDVGQGRSLTIVCGAPNVAAGLKVPCALIGAQLPNGLEIKPVTMRGVDSEGMLCSAFELGISTEKSGLLVLDEQAVPGESLRSHLQLDEQIFTIKLTPNKADCLSVIGVAREVAALTDASFQPPVWDSVPVTLNEVLPVKVSAPDLCGRFSGRVIRGVNAKAPTPEWMKLRLERSGQRSISALVDISNYVMLELGRPTHVFDLNKIVGGLHVRWGRKGEQLELLNGQTVELDEQVGVIADVKEGTEVVESLAGIMGGNHTAVSLDTTDVYVEAAFWHPDAIQGRARRYHFSTDAAHRFERGVDYATTVQHLERITGLILQICGGQAGPVDDHVVNLPARAPVKMRLERCVKVIGIPISKAEIGDIFARLGLEFEDQGDVFIVAPPTYRFDLQIEEDLIEEVVRVYGFENIPAVPPKAPAKMRAQPEAKRTQHRLRELMAALDYQEAMNFCFVQEEWETDFSDNRDPIRLLNPIASHLAVMRSSLIGSLVGNVQHNLNHKQPRIRMFELGRVFRKDAQVKADVLAVAGVAQPMMLGGIAYGPSEPEQWGLATRPVDFFDVKADVERLLDGRGRFQSHAHPALHPGRSASVWLDGTCIGILGELHPRWAQKYALPQAPVLFEITLSALVDRALPHYVEVSRMPAVVRDIAVLVDVSVPVQSMLDSLWSACRQHPELSIVKQIAVFDQYRGKGLKDNEKSLAFRITLQDTERTLNEENVGVCVGLLTDTLRNDFGAAPRG